MVGIQRLFGSRKNLQSADVSEQLDRSNHSALNTYLPRRFSSSPTLNKKQLTVPLITRLSNTLEDIYKFMTQQLTRCKGKLLKKKFTINYNVPGIFY